MPQIHPQKDQMNVGKTGQSGEQRDIPSSSPRWRHIKHKNEAYIVQMMLDAGGKVAYLLHLADETLRIIVSTEEALPFIGQDGICRWT